MFVRHASPVLTMDMQGKVIARKFKLGLEPTTKYLK